MRCPACAHDNRGGARFCEACGGALGGGPEEIRRAAPPASPQTVGAGRFKLTSLLGEGARKRVYAATDARLGREVAVALVKTDDLDEAGRQRIEREAAAMARLGNHPNIVTVFDVGEEDGSPYIVSQLMPGGSIADLLGRSPEHRLPVRDALRVATQVASALEHAHQHGVVHRDVKPANVWRADNDTVLLGDFGLAATTDQSRLTAEGLVVGTVAYLAPEQAVGRAPDARSDLYSLGALLYELLCGRPPFLGDDAVTVISQHLNTTAVAPSWHNAEVSPPLDHLVLRLLSKEPSGRPVSATAVIEELERIAETPPQEVAATPPVPARLLPFGRLVGRASELSQLTAAYDEVVSGHGRLVMVVGEPGIGKTRLVEELAVYAGVRGATICWGHCLEGELAMPYLPFVEAFRSYIRERPDDELRSQLSSGAPEVATLVSELHQRFADLPPSPPLQGEAERMRLFEGVTSFLKNAAADHPVVLLLDDLHWADKPSLLMLQYLARNSRRDRILVVGTYRDIELDRTHPLADTVASLRHENLYERVLLRGLSAPEVKALIDAVDNQDSPLAFAETIHQETEGNPFFVSEILRNLVETGAIHKVDGVWTGNIDTITQGLPEGVREVIGRRLSRLGADCNRMLTVGAAMPGGFSLDVVSGVLDLGEDHVLDLLDEALDAQVLRERRDAPGVYEFGHALIRQTLYAELSTPRRVRLHRQIATALEGRPGPEPDLGELAYHWFQGAPGGDVAKAVDYATRAAERAAAQAAHEETARFYDMALQALDLSDEAQQGRRAELLLALGSALDRGGETERAASTLAEATDLARRLGDACLFARAALATAGIRFTGGIAQPVLVSLLEEAAAALGDSDDALLSEVLSRNARLMLFVDPHRLSELVDQSLATARRSGSARAIGRSLFVSTWRYFGPEEVDHRSRALAEAGRLAEQCGDLDLAIESQMSLLNTAVGFSDPDLKDAALAGVIRLAAESRSPFYAAVSATMQGMVAALEGRYEDAQKLAGEVAAFGQRLRDPALVANVGAMLFPVWRELGRIVEFESATRKAMEEAPGVVAYRTGLAFLLSETDRYGEASVILDGLGRDGFGTLSADFTQNFNLCELAEVAVAVGDAARAKELVEILRPRAGMASHIHPLAYHGAVDRYVGLLDLCLGDADQAVKDFEDALAIHERMDAHPWTARTRYDLARALLARNHTGDRDQAVRLLNDAISTASDLGMKRLLEEALAAKLEFQGIVSSSPQASIDVVAAGVSVERPDLSRTTGVDGRVAIAFSDIEGYTAAVERLGDARSQALLRAHDHIVRDEVSAHRGRVVKSQGDGFMMAFAAPRDALACAVAIQQSISAHDFDGEAVRLRIGVHAGSVISEGDDFFGRTVILAARVAASAAGGEILTTSDIREAAPDLGYGPARVVALKGLTGTHRVYPVEWRPPSR